MVKLSRFTPPGSNMNQLKSWFLSSLILGILHSLSFPWEFIERIQAFDNIHFMLNNPDTMMYRFDHLIENALSIFPLLSLVMLPFVFFNYAYFRRESRSCYLMRRLRSPWELHIRCWTVPLLCSIVLLATMFVLYGIYLAVYLTFTPEGYMPSQEIALIGRYLP